MAILTDRRTSLSGRGSPPWPVVENAWSTKVYVLHDRATAARLLWCIWIFALVAVEVERSAGQGPEAGRRDGGVVYIYIYIYINIYLFIYIGEGTSRANFVGDWCSMMV